MQAAETVPVIAQPIATPAPPRTATAQRYVALDAFRGFIMIILASNGFGLHALADTPGFRAIARQFEHVPWEGAVFWDLIQPAFMFMVGVAMPFALARRIEQGATFRQNLGHVAARALRLLLLSQILMIISSDRLHFQLINVLAQIAFTYLFAFLIMQLKWRYQVLAAALILAGHWALFALFPGPDGAFSKILNVGARIDKALLGYNYSGYYVTINFICSTVTTLFGVWTGSLLMSQKSHAAKLKWMAIGMAGALAGGLALSPWNPLVKRLWTTSWTLYSSGWVLLMLIAFYWLVEVQGMRKLVYPLVVVGMNSIFIYSLGQVMHSWFNRAVGVFTGKFEWIGTLAPVAQSCAVLLAMWALCYWLYRRKIFLKL